MKYLLKLKLSTVSTWGSKLLIKNQNSEKKLINLID